MNVFLVSAMIAFFLSLVELGRDWLEINREALETRFFPVVTDWTFRDWEQDEAGNWAANAWVNKRRAECVFLPDQIVTVLALTDRGPVETQVRFIGDATPGNNRPIGWQKLDQKVEFTSTEIAAGDAIRGQVLHRCHDANWPTVSPFGPVIVGADSPWPEYVERWVQAGRVGRPTDYEESWLGRLF